MRDADAKKAYLDMKHCQSDNRPAARCKSNKKHIPPGKQTFSEKKTQRIERQMLNFRADIKLGMSQEDLLFK
jgi:hypothetical protein